MSSIPWFTELAPAAEQATRERRPLFIDFYSETCVGCQTMDAVTYRQAEVIETISRNYTPVKFNVKEPRPEYRELLRMAKPLFTPMFLFRDAGGTEIRRTTGYLPPLDFVAELELVLGLVEQLHGHYAEAHARFRRISTRLSASHVAPEALYWAGVAAYRCDGKGLNGLIPEWMELRDRYPGSTWWTRASCISDRMPAGAAV